MLNISIPANQKALYFLAPRNPEAPLQSTPHSSPDPDLGLGCHPDIVEHLRKRLGPALPEDCSSNVCGTPARVQPGSGILLAFILRTQYVLQLASELVSKAALTGARFMTSWAGGSTTNLQAVLGEQWVFGKFLVQETGWLRQAYQVLAV